MLPKIKIKLLFFFIVVFLFKRMKAQDHGFFNQIWLEQGLSQSSIVSMIQGNQGFMWFATQDGLNRYDGRNMDHFNFKPFDKHSISGDDIYSISLKDNILFVLNDKGLDKMDLATLQISNLTRRNNQAEKIIFFKSWILNNSLYLLGRNGLAKAEVYENNEFDFEYCLFEDSLAAENGTVVYSVCSDDKENLYASTNKGIFSQKKGDKTFKKIYDLRPAKNFKYDNERFYSTVAWKNNKLYFTNSNTLFSLDPSNLKVNFLSLQPFNSLSSILIDNQDKIWIGTTGKGLFVIKENKSDSLFLEKHFTKESNSRFALQSNEITSLYQNPDSKDGIVWIGTRDAGAFNYSYSKNSFSIPTSSVNTSDLNFFGLTKDKDGVIWAGFNSGILKVDRLNKTHHTINLNDFLNKTNRPIEAICCDNDNTVWTAFGNTLYKVDKSNNTLIPAYGPLVAGRTNNVSRIAVLNNEELLLCTSRGIIVYNKKSGKVQLTNSLNIKGQNVTLENTSAFMEDSKFNWWIGSVNGLYCIREDNKEVVFLKHDNKDSNSILSNRIMDIKESENGEILISTTKGISVIKNYGKQIKNIYAAKGLLNNFIYGMVEDHSGRFWMATNFGISIFDPRNSEFKSYTASDGICINEFNSGGYYKAEDGELIFGGLGGLVSVYPKSQVINRNVLDIVLRKITIQDYAGQIDPEKKLSLSYGQNDISFEFSVPDYSGEENINLFYRFKNKDTNLIRVNPSQLFSLSFINIAPGNYDLEVMAINKEGARSKPFSITFQINSPFWSTPWFYLILISLTVFASWIIYRSRLKRKIIYIQEIEQIRKDENEKVRKAAALDLHDEFGNGLTRISMLIEMIKIHIIKENKDAHKLLDLITQNSNRLYQGTKDFIWSINPGKDNLYEIVIRVKDYADELFYGNQATFEVIGLSEEMKLIKQTPTAGRNITMIFKESLANILKHAKAGKVKFTVKNGGENIYLILEDNGIGFEMKDYKNSFGITNIQQRAGRLAADINITSALNKGTEIVLVINLNNQEHENSIT